MGVVSLIYLHLLSITVCLLHGIKCKTYLRISLYFLTVMWQSCHNELINTKTHTYLCGVGVRRFWRKLSQFYKRKYLVLKLISQYLKAIHYNSFLSCSTCGSYIGILELLFCLLSQTEFCLAPVCQKDKDLVSPSMLLAGVKNTSVPLEEELLLIITSSFLYYVKYCPKNICWQQASNV